MKRIALIKNGLVENVALVADNSGWMPHPSFTAVDVAALPWVGPGCTYDGASFAAPAPREEPVQTIEDMAEDWINFGTNLFKEIRKQIWLINAQAQVTAEDIIALIPQSDLLQKSLEGGGLGTAGQICQALKVALPAYASVCDFAINEINSKTE